MSNKLNFKKIYTECINELYYNILTEEKISQLKKSPKQQILNGIQGMRPGEAMQLVAKSLDQNSASFLAKHLLTIIINAAKNGKIKTAAIKDAIKDFNDKNIEDNSGIDWENVSVDESGMSFKCLFDGDSKKVLMNFMEIFNDETKDIQKEVEEADKKFHTDVKRSGIKMDDQQIDDNGVIIASIIDNPKNEEKTGKELTKDVETAIKFKDDIKNIAKKTKEDKQKIAAINIDSKIEKMTDEQLEKADEEANKKLKTSDNDKNDLVQKIDKDITSKLGTDYKSSLLTGIYTIDEIKTNLTKNKLSKVDINKIKTEDILGIRIDFFGDESKDVVNEVVDEKAGYYVREITDSEKNEGIKKIYSTFSKIIKTHLKDKLETILAYLRYWNGKNDDGNFDSIFIFVGIKN